MSPMRAGTAQRLSYGTTLITIKCIIIHERTNERGFGVGRERGKRMKLPTNKAPDNEKLRIYVFVH